MFRLSTVAFVCAIASASSAVHAAAVSSANLSNIRFQVIDLNPTDGAAAFQYVGGNTKLNLTTQDNALGEADVFGRLRNGLFAFTAVQQSDLENVNASASISSQGLSLSGSAFGPGTSYSANASTGTYTDGYYYYNTPAVLSLSAQSMVIITADADVFASATNPGACSGSYYYYPCEATEQASATATMQLRYNYSSSTGSVSYSFSDALSVSAQARGAYTQQIFEGYTYSYDPYYGYYYGYYPVYSYVNHPATEQTNSASKTFTAVFMNTSDSVQTASFYLGAGINGVASTVPEPEGYALALAGLGVAGLLARRRQRAA